MECRICQDPYDLQAKKPKVLACGHSACLACLGGLNERRCPTCKKEFSCAAVDLQDNHDLMDIIRASSVKAPARAEPSGWCMECVQVTTAECGSESHPVISLQAALRQQLKQLQVPQLVDEVHREVQGLTELGAERAVTALNILGDSQAPAELVVRGAAGDALLSARLARDALSSKVLKILALVLAKEGRLRQAGSRGERGRAPAAEKVTHVAAADKQSNVKGDPANHREASAASANHREASGKSKSGSGKSRSAAAAAPPPTEKGRESKKGKSKDAGASASSASAAPVKRKKAPAAEAGASGSGSGSGSQAQMMQFLMQTLLASKQDEPAAKKKQRAPPPAPADKRKKNKEGDSLLSQLPPELRSAALQKAVKTPVQQENSVVFRRPEGANKVGEVELVRNLSEQQMADRVRAREEAEKGPKGPTIDVYEFFVSRPGQSMQSKQAELLDLVREKGVHRLTRVRCDYYPEWALQLLAGAADSVVELELLHARRGHVLALASLKRLRRLDLMGDADTLLSDKNPPVLPAAGAAGAADGGPKVVELADDGTKIEEEVQVSVQRGGAGGQGLEWLRVAELPRETVRSLVSAHAGTLEELQLLVGTRGEKGWPYSCGDLHELLRQCDLQDLWFLVLYRGCHYSHSPRRCEAQKKAVVGVKRDIGVLCGTCDGSPVQGL